MGVRHAFGLSLVVAFASAEIDEAACAKLGFAPTLLCSACTKLGEHIGEDDSLVSECQGCCTEEVAGGSGTYTQATLDIWCV